MFPTVYIYVPICRFEGVLQYTNKKDIGKPWTGRGLA